MRSQANVMIEPARPVTGRRIVRDLRRLGVESGQTLLVHASLRSLGRVIGGAPAVVRALRQAVGEDGHVVMPTGTEANSQTSRAHRARIETLTPDEVRAYRLGMAGFDPDSTPSDMGAISEALRTTDGAVRSAHPQSSFAAIGPEADLLMADHALECHLGPDSPLGKLTKADARVLMIEVGYWAFTGFHLAEYLYTPRPPTRKYACVVANADGGRSWEEYDDVVLDDQKFEDIGESMEKKVAVRRGKVGGARCRLVPLHDAVAFAAEWMAQDRG
ncbi:MAG: aminoglycoside N(3)-acetyltransferase [Trebonia sp.]